MSVTPKKVKKELLSTLLTWIMLLLPSGAPVETLVENYVNLPLCPQYLRSIYVVLSPQNSACTGSQSGTGAVLRRCYDCHLPFSRVSIQSVRSSPPRKAALPTPCLVETTTLLFYCCSQDPHLKQTSLWKFSSPFLDLHLLKGGAFYKAMKIFSCGYWPSFKWSPPFSDKEQKECSGEENPTGSYTWKCLLKCKVKQEFSHHLYGQSVLQAQY